MKHTGITPELVDWEKLLPAVIFGAEGEGDGDDSSNGSDDDGDGDEDAGSDDTDQSVEHDDADDPKVKGLKSALAAERDRAAKAERELKRRAKAEADAKLKEKSELEQSQIREQQAADRVSKLAAGFLRQNLDAAIERAALAAKFIDVSDAIAGVDRSKLKYEQDEDEPDQITIDLKSVEAEVKALATKKPHFLNKGTEDGEPTGGQFGRTPKGKKRTSEDVLREKYPSLR